MCRVTIRKVTIDLLFLVFPLTSINKALGSSEIKNINMNNGQNSNELISDTKLYSGILHIMDTTKHTNRLMY